MFTGRWWRWGPAAGTGADWRVEIWEARRPPRVALERICRNTPVYSSYACFTVYIIHPQVHPAPGLPRLVHLGRRHAAAACKPAVRGRVCRNGEWAARQIRILVCPSPLITSCNPAVRAPSLVVRATLHAKIHKPRVHSRAVLALLQRPHPLRRGDAAAHVWQQIRHLCESDAHLDTWNTLAPRPGCLRIGSGQQL